MVPWSRRPRWWAAHRWRPKRRSATWPRGPGVDVLPALTRDVAALARRLGRRLATLAHDASHCLLALVRLLGAAVLAALRVLGARVRHRLSAALIAARALGHALWRAAA